ncbi:unnamed protein product [Choristocarpus tenellus]
MYQEQLRIARWTGRQAHVLKDKIRQLEHSNEIMRSEMEHCTNEIARLEMAAEKLQALSITLDGRRKLLVEQRAKDASKEADQREEMNSSLNKVVDEISAKIKEQEAQRVSQDKENACLREELQAHIKDYEERSKVFKEALTEEDTKKRVLEEELAELTKATNEASSVELALLGEVEELAEAEV